MSASKRRKLDLAPAQPPLSAFAARRALKSSTSSKHVNEKTTPGESRISSGQTLAVSVSSQDISRVTANNERKANGIPEIIYEENTGLSDLAPEGEEELSSFHSQSEAPVFAIQRPSVGFSTYSPRKDNFKSSSNGTVSLKLAPGERLVVLGQFGLCVLKGQVTLLGATIHASEKVHTVFASSSHSLPVIRCSATDIDPAKLSLHPYESGLSSLKNLSPLFGRLWNDQFGYLGSELESLMPKSKPSTFRLLLSSDNTTQKTYMQPLISPPEWNAMLSSCSSTTHKPRMVLICGPKSSGKSTFAKLLVNRLLSAQEEVSASSKRGNNGVALLDLDPGQPEYSPPGQVSLIHVQQPNFGAPFSHPTTDPPNKSIRLHSIGTITPAMDPSLYMECALNLFSHYQNHLSSFPKCPLVINTPGWVLGTGLEILIELIHKIQPTEAIYLSQEGPPEVTQGLKSAAKSVPLLTLPSQLSEYTTRTAAHLRTMQYMSYFHLHGQIKDGLSWSGKPMTSIPPWEIRYSGKQPGILGILCYGEQPPASLLAEAINGSLVSIVVIDDLSAIPGWTSFSTTEAEVIMDQDTRELEYVEHQAFNDEDTRLGHIEKPMIVRTPDEDLPYFNPKNSICLDPKASHSIGLALIRGIDVKRKRLQVLTPIDRDVIEGLQGAGKSVVLVSGKLDTPGWAYTEDLLLKTALEKRNKGEDVDADAEMNEDEDEDDQDEDELVAPDVGLEHVPWIQRLEGSEGRGIGSRVWRVRRDLGKTDD